MDRKRRFGEEGGGGGGEAEEFMKYNLPLVSTSRGLGPTANIFYLLQTNISYIHVFLTSCKVAEDGQIPSFRGYRAVARAKREVEHLWSELTQGHLCKGVH